MNIPVATRVLLVVLGVVTATPVAVLVSPAALDYYGVTDPGPMAVALLQHRGMLQLVLGAAMVWAAFFPPARIAVALGAITTKTTNLILTLGEPSLRPQAPLFSTVFDTAAVLLLAALIAIELHTRRAQPSVDTKVA